MPKLHIYPWLNASDYNSIKRLSPDDPELPPTYKEWLEHAEEQASVFKKSGIPLIKVEISSAELKAYCENCGIAPDATGRAAFAVHKCPKTHC
jgi:hypothetical protein